MRVIHHTFAPLADETMCRQALLFLLQPWKWQRGKEIEELRGELEKRFHKKAAFFSSGRQALAAGLQAAGIGKGDEVIVQSYTCIVVPNAIKAIGAHTRYADIDEDTLNLTLETVEPLITSKTKAIICQHTFGIPADLSGLRELCDARKILLIEDCAHIMPDAKGPHGIATTGDMVLFSFGRDKAISGVTGGAILSQGTIAEMLSAFELQSVDLPRSMIMRYLLYPLLYTVAKPLYPISIGKLLLALAAKMKILIPIVTAQEKKGKMEIQAERLPNACAALALRQLQNLEQLNDHRRTLTAFYLQQSFAKATTPAGVMEGLPLQKFPIFVPNAGGIRGMLKERGIHLDDGWANCVICPANADCNAVGYRPGKDPHAESVSTSILSLPTHPTMTQEQALYLAALLKY